jgi:hypothetical protein
MSRKQHDIVLAKAEGVPWEMPPHRCPMFTECRLSVH